MDQWRTSTEQTVRAQIRDATAQNIQQRLGSIEDYQFRTGGSLEGQLQVWEKAVKAELNDEQREAWKKAVDERSAYREKATAGMILSEFDLSQRLTDEQWGKLQPMVQGFIKDYSADIGQMFSYSTEQSWYLTGHISSLPFAGLPEKELKEILTKEQWDSWSGSSQCANASSYWGNIKEVHDQREKQKEREKEQREKQEKEKKEREEKAKQEKEKLEKEKK